MTVVEQSWGFFFFTYLLMIIEIIFEIQAPHVGVIF